MTLVEAWNALAAVVGGFDAPEHKQAVKVLYGALMTLTDRTRLGGVDPASVEDQVSRAFFAVTRGVRDPFPVEDPASEAKVLKYLGTTLRRLVLRATERARKSETAFEDVREPGHQDTSSAVELANRFESVRRHVVEPWAATRRAGRGDAILRDFAEMLRLAIGQATVADLLGATDLSGAATPEALHQRHSRTRRELLQYVEDHAGVTLSEEDAEVYRELLELLSRRRTDTPRSGGRGRA